MAKSAAPRTFGAHGLVFPRLTGHSMSRKRVLHGDRDCHTKVSVGYPANRLTGGSVNQTSYFLPSLITAPALYSTLPRGC